MERKTTSHFVAGLLVAVVYIILFLAYYYKGLSFSENNLIIFAPYIASFALIVTAVVLYGRSKNNKVTFGQLFNYGFKTTAIFVLVIVVFMLLFLKISDYKMKLDTEMATRIKTESDLSGNKKDLAMNLTGALSTIIIGGAIFTNVIIGAFASVAAASFARKDYSALHEK